MWDALERDLATFPSAVVTWVDDAGYPFSARCQARPERAEGVITLDLSANLPVRPSPAGLLCHAHDERLWHLRSFIVKGSLERRDTGWVLLPEQRAEGAGYGGLRGQVRFIRRGRRTAAAYLRARGLPPPRIDWRAFKELKRRATGAGGPG
jgi:hypothetical protein